jgi:hypothetical protein
VTTKRDLVAGVGIDMLKKARRAVFDQTGKRRGVTGGVVMFTTTLATKGKTRGRRGRGDSVVPNKGRNLAGGVADLQRQTGNKAIERELTGERPDVRLKAMLN